MSVPKSNHELRFELSKELGIPFQNVAIIGSTLICGKGNDIDFLCLVDGEAKILGVGFEPDLEVKYESDLHSYRRGEWNAIATTSPDFFHSEIAIAHAAKIAGQGNFDMKSRIDRVSFHAQVRHAVQLQKTEEFAL